MVRIDAHIHVNGDHPDCLALLERLDLKLLNVCVAHAGDDWRAWREACRALAEQHPQRYAWCTTFDVPDFSPTYAERVIAELEQDLTRGAIACKVWKNVGMEIRKPFDSTQGKPFDSTQGKPFDSTQGKPFDALRGRVGAQGRPSGEFLMIDDPLFDPIFNYLARSGIPALMHIGEPLRCWQPLDDNGPHDSYYRLHPEWHMYTKPDYPSHRQIMDARDRMLARHPKLRVIGAHLGSLEYDVKEIARRLDRYPNFAVDTSARMRDLAIQDPETVRQFFLAYPDRILFGTDVVARQALSGLPDADRDAWLARIEAVYQREFAYFETEQVFQVVNREVRGLGLPEAVLTKLYHDNAAAWYPGLL